MSQNPKPPKGMTRGQMPLTSFDPRYKDLLLKGCHERVEIPTNSEKDAHRLQSLLCTFRARAKKENVEGWEALYGTIVTKTADLKGVLLRPRADELDTLISGEIKTSSPIEPEVLKNDPLAEFLPVENEETNIKG